VPYSRKTAVAGQPCDTALVLKQIESDPRSSPCVQAATKSRVNIFLGVCLGIKARTARGVGSCPKDQIDTGVPRPLYPRAGHLSRPRNNFHPCRRAPMRCAMLHQIARKSIRQCAGTVCVGTPCEVLPMCRPPERASRYKKRSFRVLSDPEAVPLRFSRPSARDSEDILGHSCGKSVCDGFHPRNAFHTVAPGGIPSDGVKGHLDSRGLHPWPPFR